MSLNHRQLHRLHRIESGLLRSDPQLAARLAVFASLAAGEHLPAWEQLATRPDRIRQAAALIVKAVTLLATAIALLLNAVRGLVRAVVMGDRPRPRTEGTSAVQPRHDDQGWNPAQGS
ncbi:MAG TPA: hypothetical protein VNO25_18990 [Streptosporangiaceae bacterium]|nr:hypothetical protein [Streptosporangiaceae bacterium]